MQLNINSDLEVVACTILFKDYKLNVCNLYLPNHADVDIDSLNNLLKSIPDPKIVLGDFNARHTSWGAPTNCPRGRVITDSFLENDLIILNDGSPTRYDRYANTHSHIDVTCCSTVLGNKLDWSILELPYRSDHYPIIIYYDFEQYYTKGAPDIN